MGQKLDTGCQFNLLQFLTAFFSGQLLACGFGLEFSTGAYLGVAQLFPIKTSPSYLYPFSIPSISDLSSLFSSILFFHRHFTAGFPCPQNFHLLIVTGGHGNFDPLSWIVPGFVRKCSFRKSRDTQSWISTGKS